MTRNAALGADRTYGGVRLSGGWRPTLMMAAQAFRIVEGNLAHSRAVGIMAGEAANARVHAIPAVAVFEPIRLKPDIIDPSHLHRLNRQPSAMARTAEVH